MKQLVLFLILLCVPVTLSAQKVTVHADREPAAKVFRSIVEQTGRNFVYSSALLKDVRVSVHAKNKPLKRVLSDMFRGTEIEYSFRGNNIVLKRKRPAAVRKREAPRVKLNVVDTVESRMLEEVVVVSRLEAPSVETAEIGAEKITAEDIRNTPVAFGENDVIKTVQMQPGVTEGIEGFAGMYVHGGNADENLYMLDNVPVYQVNHFAGLFSAFNTETIRYVDFFKSSIPAKYDGRLSSFMDVRLKTGVPEGHHGSAKLGLTSGAFNISGPIGSKTTYLVGLRRSWYDLLTIPLLAIANSSSDGEKIRFQYYFMDLNAKVNHRFSENANGFVSVYFGDDLLKTGSKELCEGSNGWSDDDKFDFHWGNLIVQAGLNYRLSPQITSEFTAAYTRFFSSMKHDDISKEYVFDKETEMRTQSKTDNNINDWIFRGDFDWQPHFNSRVRFGVNYVRHSFLPSRTVNEYTFNATKTLTRDLPGSYGANEFNAYIEDDWKLCEHVRLNAGVHGSLFNIEGRTNHGFSPRLSISYRPIDNLSVKAAYSRTTQYVHQLTQSYLALPTDQWVPITGNFKPQTADKVSVGGYWQTAEGDCSVSVEGYYKYMRNLIDYKDEYYLWPPQDIWNARLTSGHGTAKGVDLNVEKSFGRVSGRVSYSLAWADRTFKEKNGGVTYPARFDNRHSIKILVNWDVSDKVQLNAAWSGHSGNRFTFMPQVWTGAGFGSQFGYGDVPLRCGVNNYQLPFYHRLDLSCTVRNRRGFWTFSVYNAYCHMNTIAIRCGYKEVFENTPDGWTYTSKPVFQKVKLLPIIPSVSYTWQF